MTNAVSDPDEVARLKAELAVARAELTGARLIIEQLKAQLAVLRRMSFGRSSEKLTSQITQLELLLEDLEEGEAERVAPVPVSALNERERRQPVRRPLPPHLPREEVLMVPRFRGHGFRPFVVRPVPGSDIRERSGSAAGYSSPRYTRRDRVWHPRGSTIAVGGQVRP
ncbi:hypothetical protein SPAN111604_13265 [Sphingomonas antarctica]